MQNKPVQERRAYTRFYIDIPLNYSYRSSDEIVKALSHDISPQGICIISSKPLPDGVVLDMCIKMLDNGEKIFVRGKVIWLQEFNWDKYKIGIQLCESSLNPYPLILRAINAKRQY